VPKATFAGPDACSGNVTWTTNFARALKHAGNVRIVTEHFYVGAGGRDIPAPRSIDNMLSPGWLGRNQRLYDQMAIPVLAEGLPYRFTEASDRYQGGTPDASNAFAGALWVLDFLHWWAAHGATGVDFHNTQWVVNDVITPGADGRLTINPKGYGLKAFELGSHGSIERVRISNPQRINLTAYALRGPAEHCVTLINKEYGPDAREVSVSLVGIKSAAGAAVSFLESPGREVGAKSGVTLGAAAITAHSPWVGKWRRLRADRAGQLEIKVPAASAAVVRIPTQ
jgi:hypothetical protein